MNWFFDKPLAKLIRIKKTQNINNMNEIGDISIAFTDIRRIKREYYE